MITTVCLNPSYDKTAKVETLVSGGLNCLSDIRCDIGGKGINVARVLRRLSVETVCVGCVGAENGAAFLDMVNKEDVRFVHTELPGSMRTNLKVFDQSTRAITELNEPGLIMTEDQQQAWLLLWQQQAEASDYIVLSGRLPVGCRDDFYLRCMQAVTHPQCVLDSAGVSLLKGLEAQPYLIKPNIPEIETVMGCELTERSDVAQAAKELVRRGAQNVIVSMGKQGALFTNGKQVLFAPALDVPVQSTVGAGDAMVGGVLAGLAKGEPLERAFCYGVAAASASVMTAGTQMMNIGDFEALLPIVTLQEL